MAATLDEHLGIWADGDAGRGAVRATVLAMAAGAAELADLIAIAPLLGAPGAVVGDNADGDAQKQLDVRANELFLAALRNAPVAQVISEENVQPVALDPAGTLMVAMDPLDGSSNIETNVSIGTIFGIEPALDDLDAPLRTGAHLLAGGFVVYGPQTMLVLTVRAGTHVFILDRRNGSFVMHREAVRIPAGKPEYAINASNYRHWDDWLRGYVDDCVAGGDGPHDADFNMRWIASLVAEAFRILARGGVFLYPRDSRPGYENGRLRLVYEAAPLGLVFEEAGGAATDGTRRILDLAPESPHQRTPLVLGSPDHVARVASYRDGRPSSPARAPLFGRRGLFRN